MEKPVTMPELDITPTRHYMEWDTITLPKQVSFSTLLETII